jgi:PAS domain S-box-containing protein
VAAGVIAGFELASMHAETTAQYGVLLRWAHLPVWVLIVSVVWFVRLYLRAGRPWLAWSVCGLRTLALALNFLFTPNLNYREITSLRHLAWWGGETVSAPVGVPSMWTLVGELGLLLLIIFFVDATITVWRRGDRGRALVLGGSAIAFTTLALGQSALVIWGVIESPFFVSFPYLGIIAAMGYELSSDVLRAAQLTRQLQASEADLRETEQRMELAASAADLGMWVWDIERDDVWMTDKRRALYGFAPSEKLDIERLRNVVHPEDRESVRVAVDNALNTGAEYDTEYRIVLPAGQVRWMSGRGRVEFNREGKPVRMRGVALDITERWHAGQELQQLRQEIAHVSLGLGPRDQSAAGRNLAQRRGGGAFHPPRIARPQRNLRHPCRHPKG